MSLKELIDDILSRYGVDILLNGNLFCSILSDVAPNYKLEQRVMRRMAQDDLLKEVHEFILDKEKDNSTTLNVLLQYAGYSNEWCQIALSSFGFNNQISYSTSPYSLQIPSNSGSSNEIGESHNSEIEDLYSIIEDEDWEEAERIINRLLKSHKNNFEALIGKLLCVNCVTSVEQLMLNKVIDSPFFNRIRNSCDIHTFRVFYERLNKKMVLNSNDAPWFSITIQGNICFDGDLFSARNTNNVLVIPYRFIDYINREAYMSNEVLIANELAIEFTGDLSQIKTIIISDDVGLSTLSWLKEFYNLEKLFLPENMNIELDTHSLILPKLRILHCPLNSDITFFRWRNFPSLEEIILPNELDSILPMTFKDCSSIKRICLPERLERITFCLFSGCTSLTEVYIPDSVTEIGSQSFENCTKLQNVIIPESVTKIGSYTFAGCKNLKNIVVPKSVTEIGNLAFNKCTLLESVEIYSDNIELGDGLFNNCDSLINLSFKVNAVYKVLDNVLYNALEHKSISVFGNYKSSLRIPDFCEVIGSCTFWECNKIKSIVLPSSIKQIEGNPFSSCNSLTDIDVSTCKRYYISDHFLCNNDDNSIITYLFGHIEKQILIGDPICKINKLAFSDYVYLEQVIIGDNVKTICEQAFWGCSNLKRVDFSKCLIELGESVFANCNKLTILNFFDTLPITSIPQRLFLGCESIKELQLPPHVKTIEEFAFYGCESLTTISLPDELTEIKSNAFLDCKNLTEVMLPNGLIDIGDYAFMNCYNLSRIVIPQSVRNISEHIFYAVKNLTIINYSEHIIDALSKIVSYHNRDCNIRIVDGNEFELQKANKKREEQIESLRRSIDHYETLRALQRLRYEKLRFKFLGKGLEEKRKIIVEIDEVSDKIESLKQQLQQLIDS